MWVEWQHNNRDNSIQRETFFPLHTTKLAGGFGMCEDIIFLVPNLVSTIMRLYCSDFNNEEDNNNTNATAAANGDTEIVVAKFPIIITTTTTAAEDDRRHRRPLADTRTPLLRARPQKSEIP